jgi:hypothetical protein
LDKVKDIFTSTQENRLMRTILLSAVLAALLSLTTATQAHAYGACHTGYTTCGPNGVQHSGSTTVSGPGGTASHTGSTTSTPYGTEHTGTTTATGAYGGAYAGSTTRAYSPTTYGSYSAVGTTGAYHSSVTRVGVAP